MQVCLLCKREDEQASVSTSGGIVDGDISHEMEHARAWTTRHGVLAGERRLMVGLQAGMG